MPIQWVENIIGDALKQGYPLVSSSLSSRLNRLRHRLRIASNLVDAAVLEDPATSVVVWRVLGQSGIYSQPLSDYQVIGRGENCAVRLDFPDVSREHAALSLQGSSVTITDLNSLNGTLVNGEYILSSQLRSGDVVRIGNAVLVVMLGC